MTAVRPGHAIYRLALLAESAGNFGGGVAAFCFPTQCLRLILSNPAHINPLTVQLLQWFGAISWALMIPLLAGFPDTVTGVANRRPAYLTLGLAEAVVIPLNMYTWRSDDYPFTDNFFYGMLASVGGLLGFRLYALFVDPALMGGLKQHQT